MDLKRAAAIIGIGELKPRRETRGQAAIEVMAEAAKLAIQDAGLDKKDIDGLLVGPPLAEQSLLWPTMVGEYMGIRPAFAETVDLGGASACGMVWRAAAAIAAGLCRAAVCVTGDVLDTEAFYSMGGRPPKLPLREFENPYGPMGANSGYAMIAMRHMHEFGTTSRQLAKVAVDQRINANANPDALFFDRPLTIDDVLNSPLVCDPLHLYEIVLPCTGGAAVVVAAPDIAKRAPHRPVWLLGAAEKVTHMSLAQAPSLTTSPIAYTAARAFEMAGVTPKDIDLVSVYDCYTITVIITLEDAGFCPKGKGGPFVEEHDLTYKGDLPTNTHGGQLSFGQAGLAGGMSHVTEAARQLQGRADKRQVKDCQLAFVNGNGGILSEEVSLVLGVE
ncbi:MAG: thiolase family protein [Dehalococcoidia bacterium]|jgi:acetyl-CoA acetyltransferase|nr:thiolase family protein [Dehalococcoidia bacterium]MDW8009742.1 thiolase family protein [Chloroflexota bacterium]